MSESKGIQQERVDAEKRCLDAHVREIVRWHFDGETGTPFWLEFRDKLSFDPVKEVLTFEDLRKFPLFEDVWLRGGPVRRWVPKALQDEPIYVFETGGTTGIPKSRISIQDFRIDYELFSQTLPAFTVADVADAISKEIDVYLDEAGATEVTAKCRGDGGERLVKRERRDYLWPNVIHCDGPEMWLANKECMFPFVSVVRCPQAEMIEAIGPTLVGSGITHDETFLRELRDAVNIDRLNLGPVPTIKLNCLQPHEGNIIDFLYRARAYQEGSLSNAGPLAQTVN